MPLPGRKGPGLIIHDRSDGCIIKQNAAERVQSVFLFLSRCHSASWDVGRRDFRLEAGFSDRVLHRSFSCGSEEKARAGVGE